MLNLGLESYRNRFGEAIVKAVLLFILRCRLHMDVTDTERSHWPPRRLLLGVSVVSLAIGASPPIWILDFTKLSERIFRL